MSRAAWRNAQRSLCLPGSRRAAEFAGGLRAPALEGALEGFRRGEAEQVGDFAETQLGVADIGHRQVAAGVVEDVAKARAFLGQLAAQGPAGQLQSPGDLLQIRLAAMQQRAEQLDDAFAQAAGA